MKALSEKIDASLLGFGERMKNISIFAPILQLKNKSRYSELPLVELGFATLLFMLENMLSNIEKHTTKNDLLEFLQTILYDKYNKEYSMDQIEDIRDVLLEFLRNNGEKHTFRYYNFETSKEEFIRFDLIEYKDFDITEARNGTAKLVLSSDGLEMMFKTKEMYNELQISITQLYFKQQIQKGLFDGALLSVKELNVSIINEIEKMKDLQIRIMKNALEVSKKNELEQRLEVINDKLAKEKVTFQELKSLVEETLERYYNGSLTAKEEKSLDIILNIQKELLMVISLHETLFVEKQRLQQAMNHSIESIIINAFSMKVNFEKDFLYPLIRKQVDGTIVKQIINPILPIRQNAIFNLSKIFEEQRITKKNEETVEEIPQIDEETIIQQELEAKEKEIEKENRLEEYLYYLTKPLLSKESVTVSEVLDQVKNENPIVHNDWMVGMEFYSFLITLHQSEYKKFEEIRTDMLDYLPPISKTLAKLTNEYPDLIEIGYFSFYPNGRIITLDNGYVLSDFTIQRGNLYAAGLAE